VSNDGAGHRASDAAVVRDERIAPDLVLEIGRESAAVDRRADIADGNQQPLIVGQ
jgi:hypothetical protein